MWNTDDLLKFADEVGGVDKNFKNFLSTADTSVDLMEQYQKSTVSSTTATSAFGATLKTIAANMGIMIAATLAIKGAMWVFDQIVHRQENLNEAASKSAEKYEALQGEVDSLNSELKDTNDKVDTLNEKPNLTFVEQEELQNLKDANAELERQIKLKEADANIANNKARNDAVKALENKANYGSREGFNVNSTDLSYETDKMYLKTFSSGTLTENAEMQLADYEKFVLQKEALDKRMVSMEDSNPDGYMYDIDYNTFKNASLELEKWINDLELGLSDSSTSLDAFKKSLDPTQDANLITSINQFQDDYSEKFKSSAQDVTKSFDDVWNSSDFSKQKEALEAISKAGNLDSSVLSTEEYRRILEATGASAKGVADHINAIVRESDKLDLGGKLSSDFLREFESLPLDKIENFISLFKDGLIDENNITSFEELSVIMGKTGISAKDAVDSIEGFSKTFNSSIDLTNNIQEMFDLLEKVKEEVDKTSVVSLDSLNSIANKFPELTSATSEYAQGLISTADLMVLLEQAYENDANAFRSAMAAKLEGNEAFFSTIMQNNQGLFTELANAYGVDVSNWKSMAQAKAAIDQALIQKLGQAWGQYYGVVINQATGLASLINKTPTTGLTPEQSVDLIVARTNAQSMVSSFNHAKEAMDKAAQITIDVPDFGGIGGGSKSSGGGGKGGSDGSGSSSEKEIDWIDRKLKLLEDKRSQLESKASSSFLSYLGLDENSIATAKDIIGKLSNEIGISNEEFDLLASMSKKAGLSMTDFYDAIQNGGLESRKGHLETLLQTDTALLEEYSSAAESYKQAYEKSLEGLSDEIRNKVENGGDDVTTYKGEEGERVQAAIDARDKYLESTQKESDQKTQLAETTKMYYENEIAHLDAQSDRLVSQNDLINAQIDYLTTSGQVVNASTYEAVIANLRQQEQFINEKLKQRKLELEAMMDSGDVKEDSKEYYELQGHIKDCEKSLIDLNTQQEEFKNKLMQLPIDRMDAVIGMYQDMNTAMTNWADEAEASGKKVSAEYYAELIKNGMTIIDQYREQADMIRDVMDEYDAGEENWNTLYNRLQSINSEMSSMVQNLHKWNEALLQMPIDSVSDLSSSLQKALDAMSSLQSDYDAVISAVTGAIKEQIDALNEERDLINEQKNAQIEVLQKRLELLQQQNEALDLQKNLEQALYNLQNVNTQETETVIRNGKVVYETNAENIKNAQEEVQNALDALEEYKLSQEIKDLEKELDSINEKYEDQIKQLDKISEKWSEIASKIEQANNESLANDYLGNGWKEDILSGNDTAIFNTFQGMYQKLSDQMTQYEEQIQSTENIHKLLQDYIQSYKEGNITYEQASKGISELLSQMNQKMSAMDNLDNVLDFLGTANGSESSIEGVLDGIQSSLTETADELLKSFQTYNENAGLISEYTTSWQQLTTNVEDIRDLIEEVRDNLEDVINDISYRDDDDKDEKKPSGGSSVVTTPGSPGGSYVTGGGGDYVNSGPGVRMVEKKHDGIQSGLIGEDTRKRVEQLKLIASDELKPSEVYSKLLEGEAVFTEEQQRNLLKNFKEIGYGYNITPLHMPEMVSTNNMSQPMDNRIYVDTIKLPDVTNADEFANAMKRLGTDLRQIKSRPAYLNHCK